MVNPKEKECPPKGGRARVLNPETGKCIFVGEMVWKLRQARTHAEESDAAYHAKELTKFIPLLAKNINHQKELKTKERELEALIKKQQYDAELATLRAQRQREREQNIQRRLLQQPLHLHPKNQALLDKYKAAEHERNSIVKLHNKNNVLLLPRLQSLLKNLKELHANIRNGPHTGHSHTGHLNHSLAPRTPEQHHPLRRLDAKKFHSWKFTPASSTTRVRPNHSHLTPGQNLSTWENDKRFERNPETEKWLTSIPAATSARPLPKLKPKPKPLQQRPRWR